MPVHDQLFTGSGQSPNVPPKTKQQPKDREVLLAEANAAVYKQNVELSIRNKTLSVLRRVSDITMRATGVAEVTQRIVDIITEELGLAVVLISLVDAKEHLLYPAAITQTKSVQEALKLLGKPLSKLVISLDNTHNLAVAAIVDKEQKITGNLLDLLTPLTDQELSDEIKQVMGIKTLIMYPLLLADRALGVLCLGLTKSVNDLSRAEKETLLEVISVVAIAIDRAQLLENIRKANNQLESANQRLELLDKLKDEFVSVASHELRTPMTAIKSYAWLALNGRGGAIDPKAREYIARVYSSTERLIRLVNEMLDISRIEGGKVTLNTTAFSIRDLVQDIQNEFSAKAAELGLTLAMDLPNDAPSVLADREKIHQVMKNLVGNACKFTDRGGTITISARRKNGFVEVSVADTGRGIKQEDMGKLFTKFGRLEHSLVTITGSGSGLELYICKQYVELSGGTISAESEEGRGSTFTFTLPAA